MTLDEIQARIDRVVTVMVDRGLVNPGTEFDLIGHCAPKVFARHYEHVNGRPYPKSIYYWGNGDTLTEMLDDLDAWADALPTADERHREVLLRKAADAADYAEKHLPDDPIAETVRAALIDGMQRLSENAIGRVA